MAAHPHDDSRGGYSYSVQISDEPGDTTHFDTKSGTRFTEEDLCALRVYWQLVRDRKKKL